MPSKRKSAVSVVFADQRRNETHERHGQDHNKLLMQRAREVHRIDSRTAMSKIVGLMQLERQYGDLYQRPDGSPRRLSVELSGLTRKPSSGEGRNRTRIGETICDLLIKTEDKGKAWAAEECAVCFMEE